MVKPNVKIFYWFWMSPFLVIYQTITMAGRKRRSAEEGSVGDSFLDILYHGMFLVSTRD